MPVESKMNTSSSRVRPGFLPATIAPSSAYTSPREMIRCDRRRGAGAQHRELDRVHYRQGAAVVRVEEKHDALDRRDLSRKIRVCFGAEAAVHGGGLDVKRAALLVRAENARRMEASFTVRAERLLDRGDAVVEREKVSDVGAGQQ